MVELGKAQLHKEWQSVASASAFDTRDYAAINPDCAVIKEKP